MSRRALKTATASHLLLQQLIVEHLYCLEMTYIRCDMRCSGLRVIDNVYYRYKSPQEGHGDTGLY